MLATSKFGRKGILLFLRLRGGMSSCAPELERCVAAEASLRDVTDSARRLPLCSDLNPAGEINEFSVDE
jgi:hypothetical protein